MSTFLVEKVVSALPTMLASNAVYYVRTRAGFDIYVSDSTGSIAHKLNPPLTWSHLLTQWSELPQYLGRATGPAPGRVWMHKLEAVSRYRFVPDAYSPKDDAFYLSFSDGVCSQFLVSRG